MKRPHRFYLNELLPENVDELYTAVHALMDIVEELQEKVAKLEREEDTQRIRKE